MRKFLCLIVCLSLLLCTSCGNSSQTNTDQNNNANACSYVDFSVEPFDTTVNAGEKKTFKASLTNISGEELELFHGVYLITFYVHTEKQPKTFVTTSLGITTNMAIDETIDKEVNFNFETPCLVTISYINYAEATYDYGIFSQIDGSLGTTYTADSGCN